MYKHSYPVIVHSSVSFSNNTSLRAPYSFRSQELMYKHVHFDLLSEKVSAETHTAFEGRFMVFIIMMKWKEKHVSRSYGLSFVTDSMKLVNGLALSALMSKCWMILAYMEWAIISSHSPIHKYIHTVIL